MRTLSLGEYIQALNRNTLAQLVESGATLEVAVATPHELSLLKHALPEVEAQARAPKHAEGGPGAAPIGTIGFNPAVLATLGSIYAGALTLPAAAAPAPQPAGAATGTTGAAPQATVDPAVLQETTRWLLQQFAVHAAQAPVPAVGPDRTGRQAEDQAGRLAGTQRAGGAAALGLGALPSIGLAPGRSPTEQHWLLSSQRNIARFLGTPPAAPGPAGEAAIAQPPTAPFSPPALGGSGAPHLGVQNTGLPQVHTSSLLANSDAKYVGGGVAAGLGVGLIVSGLHSLHPAAGALVTTGFMIVGAVAGAGVHAGVIDKIGPDGVRFTPPASPKPAT